MTESFDVASGNASKYMKIFNRKIEADNDLTEGESEAEDKTDILEETEDVPGVLCIGPNKQRSQGPGGYQAIFFFFFSYYTQYLRWCKTYINRLSIIIYKLLLV